MSKARKKQRLLEDTVKDTQMDFQFLQARHDGDVEFIDVFRLKKNLNHTKLPFSGPGKAKLLMWIDHGITAAKELLACDGGSPKILPQWANTVQEHYDKM